ncbi:methylated-DNA--[protein]-cysteine S-methyltransferase [Rhodopseudomonas sp. HC1]|uniref:methylated-DNA--[protein]-cysteine S-methyltransferase n=1 Tax=Rhodopseudomonas infernalis TaxID=2897386 RepID=UPI001EE87698|nr:methylated-DNA--[protein]-cysteine S-methyltransferase [Rhodopseudomonas infernalis]MCG6203986.1 methylated-DNA--[protein]-cysteine S-methyltransferase [Rhodopseudomonas infernalis]
MVGPAYAIFDTLMGRCGIAWGDDGILAVQLAESREIDTRRRLLRQCPDARESRPTPEAAGAIAGIAAILRGAPADFSDIQLDLGGLPAFDCRVYDAIRAIPRGETATHADLAQRVGSSGALHAVGHAIRRNPFALIVPCHRALQTAGDTSGICANGGVITRRRLLAMEGALAAGGPSLFDVLLAAAPRQPER